MNKQQELLGELERKIMLILWEADAPLKPAQVSDILERSYAYTTVMTVLKRLHDKGLLKRKQQGRVYFYSPKTDKKLFTQNRLGKFYDEIINDFDSLAISQFVDSVKKNEENLTLLREYLKKNAK